MAVSEAATVRIPVAGGPDALIDRIDAERVQALAWHTKRSRSRPELVYVQTTVRLTPGRKGRKTSLQLHRFIVGAPPRVPVDHRNGDTFDCRRENLRICTHRQNSEDVVHSKNLKRGGFKGVSWNRHAGKWQASIGAGEVRPNGKRRLIYLGLFLDPSAAARAYDAAALEHFGDFAALNFPGARP